MGTLSDTRLCFIVSLILHKIEYKKIPSIGNPSATDLWDTSRFTGCYLRRWNAKEKAWKASARPC